jgi:tetratricopeptide (TPR) repeat protein
MYELLSSSKEGFKKWEFKTEVQNIHATYPLLSANVLNFIYTQYLLNDKKILPLAETIYREVLRIDMELRLRNFSQDFSSRLKKYGGAGEYNCFGILIIRDHVTTDLNGQTISTDQEKYKAAEICFREAIKRGLIPGAYVNLGALIERGGAITDLNGQTISTDQEKYKAAEICFREAIKKGSANTCNLGLLIEKGHIKTDLNGRPIEESEKYEAAATFYKEAIKRQITSGYFFLGLLIERGHIKTDLNGRPIEESEKYKAAETCYREAIKKGLASGYNNLGLLIEHGHVKTDLNGRSIEEGQKYKAAEMCYREAIKTEQMIPAYSNLVSLYLRYDCELNDNERLQKIIDLLEGKTFFQGILAAVYNCFDHTEKANDQMKSAFTSGVSSTEIQLAISSQYHKDDEESDTENVSSKLSEEEEEEIIKSNASPLVKVPAPSPTQFETRLTLQSIATLEDHKRNNIDGSEKDERKKISLLFAKNFHKLSASKPLSKKERLSALIKENND